MLNITVAYIILIFLVLRFSVTLFNFLSNPKLGKYGRHFTDKVTIIIDATEDTGSLFNLLTAIQQQDYQPVEVIVEVQDVLALRPEITAFCRNDQRFRWRKKDADHPNPAEETEGNYILFLDVNTIINNGLINSMIYRTRVFNLALLSIIPTQSFTGFKNYCLIPLNNFVLLNLTPLRLIRLIPSAVFSAGSNQCMFFDAAIYRKYEWEQRLQGRLPEALEVIKAVKQEGFKVETLLGNKLIYTVIPNNIDGFFQKTGRLLLRKFGNNILAALLYLLLV
ncbi:MAG TPA: glycosyltransferase family 2 protein, partial [Pedobacter sp.]